MIQSILSSEFYFQKLSDQVSELSVSAQDKLIQCALKCVENRTKYGFMPLNSPSLVRDYLKLSLGEEKNEVFGVLFLDIRYQLLAFEKLFRGTIDAAEIHPRVVLQRTLFHNAGAVIFVHNHPSGEVKPSQADQAITELLKKALELIDVKVLDHIIVSANEAFSLEKDGLI